MSRYRYTLRCPHCKKVYANEYYNALHHLTEHWYSLCPKCGEVSDSFEKAVARPRLFGLLGWEVKEKEELCES